MFISAVIGGLGSLGGAFLGALYLRGTAWFITAREWQLLSTGAGVLLVLLVLPGGLGGLWVRVRDLVVRGDHRAATRSPSSTPDLGPEPVAPASSHRPTRARCGRRTGLGARVSTILHNIAHPVRGCATCAAAQAAYPLIVLFGLNAVDELDRTAFGILLPNIRDEFNLDNTAVLGLVAVASVGALALQVPIAQFADRSRRVPLAVAGALRVGHVQRHDRSGRPASSC